MHYWHVAFRVIMQSVILSQNHDIFSVHGQECQLWNVVKTGTITLAYLRNANTVVRVDLSTMGWVFFLRFYFIFILYCQIRVGHTLFSLLVCNLTVTVVSWLFFQVLFNNFIRCLFLLITFKLLTPAKFICVSESKIESLQIRPRQCTLLHSCENSFKTLKNLYHDLDISQN